MAYIEMKNSTKLYHMGSTTITANDNVSFTIEQGELAIILGASGAGKSTVLNILGGMDANTSGQVIIDGKDISNYTPKQLTAYRRTSASYSSSTTSSPTSPHAKTWNSPHKSFPTHKTPDRCSPT